MKTAEEIFEEQNPQDGTIPEWAKKVAQTYALQFQNPELPSFPEGMDNQKRLPSDYKIKVEAEKYADEFCDNSDNKWTFKFCIDTYISGAKWLRSQAERGVKESEEREAVKWFAKEMEAKLKANDHKGGWNKCELQYLSMRLTQERKELTGAIQSKDSDLIIKECADIANFAMMIADKFKHNYGK